jgi:hypothetical protein
MKSMLTIFKGLSALTLILIGMIGVYGAMNVAGDDQFTKLIVLMMITVAMMCCAGGSTIIAQEADLDESEKGILFGIIVFVCCLPTIITIVI